jgi:hypothetical protein
LVIQPEYEDNEYTVKYLYKNHGFTLKVQGILYNDFTAGLNGFFLRYLAEPIAIAMLSSI